MQSFNGGASSTGQISSATASSTNLFVSSVLSALHLSDAAGKTTAYGGTTCTNQFVRSLNAIGLATCNSVSLTTDVTGTLGVSNGGTASTTLGGILSGNGTTIYSSATTTLIAGTNVSFSGGTPVIVGSNPVTINATAGGSSFAYLFPVNGNATTSPLGIYASTTIGNGTVTGGLTVSGTATTTNLINTSITSALYLADASSKATAYAGSTCTNQFVRSLNGAGAATCNTVSLTADVTGILPVLNGGTNASSFTTTGNGIYWDGTRLVTAPTGSAVTYPYASTTMVTATTASSTNLNVSGIRSALHLGDANGLVGAYGGSVCTNQFVRSLNGAGTATCATVANADLAFSSITINGTSVSLGGSIIVASTTLLVDNNKYSALQSFNGGASSTGEITSVTSSSTNEIVSSIRSALHLGDTNGVVGSYGGSACTGQYVLSLSALGVATCGTLGVFGYPFTFGNNYNTVTSATTSAVFAQGGLFASTTVAFGDALKSVFSFNTVLGTLGIGTTTANAQVQLATTTGKQILLTDTGAGAGLKNWIVSSFGGLFQISTTTDSYATSTNPTFLITKGGQVGTGVDYPATSTAIVIDWQNSRPNIMLQMGTAAFTIYLTNATNTLMDGSRKVITICNPNATAGAVTWKGVEWFGGPTPTQTTTANQCDDWAFRVTAATSSGATSFKVAGYGIAAGLQ